MSLRKIVMSIGFSGSKAMKGLKDTDKAADKTKKGFMSLGRQAKETGKGIGKIGQDATLAERGLKTLGRGLDTAKRKTKELGAEAKKVGQQMRTEFKDAMEDAAPKNKFDGAKRVGATALAGGAIGVGVIGKAVKTYADFEAAMSRVGALSSATKTEMGILENTARELGAATTFSASEAAEGMQYLAMAGFKTKEIVGAMPGMLDMAAAAQIDLGRASDISSNILSAFGLRASEMGKVADVLTKAFTSSNTDLEMLGDTMKYVGPVAKAAGYSLAETAAAAGLLGDIGIQAGQAGTALRSTMLRLADPPKETAKALSTLGVSVTDGVGKMRPLHDIIGQIGKGMKGMGEAQKLAYVSQIAGTEAASAFMALVDLGPGKLAEFTGALENSGGTAREVADKQLNNLRGALEELGGAFEEASISIGKGPAGAIGKLAVGATNLVNRFNKLSPKTKGLIVNIGALATGLLTLGGAALIIIGFLPSIAAGFSMLGTISLGALGPIALAIAGVVAAGILLYKNWDKVKGLGQKFGIWIQGLGKRLKEAKDNAIGWLKRLPGEVAEQIGYMIGRAVTELQELPGEFSAWFKQSKDNAIQWVSALPGEIGEFLSSIPGQVKESIGAIWDSFRELGSAIPAAIVQGFNKAKEGLSGLGRWVVDKASLGIEGAKNLGQRFREGFERGRIPQLAKGTKSFGGGLAMVGEQGPELVRMPRGAQVFSHRETDRILTPSVANYYITPDSTPIRGDRRAATSPISVDIGDITINTSSNSIKETIPEIKREIRNAVRPEIESYFSELRVRRPSITQA